MNDKQSSLDLVIKVCQAHIKIEDGSTFYRLDPFVTITCMGTHYHTEISRLNGFLPTWNLKFRIKNIQNLDEYVLFQVYRCPSKSLNQRSSVLIGQRRLTIWEFLPDQLEENSILPKMNKWFNMFLKNNNDDVFDSGRIRIKTRFIQTSDTDKD